MPFECTHIEYKYFNNIIKSVSKYVLLYKPKLYKNFDIQKDTSHSQIYALIIQEVDL